MDIKKDGVLDIIKNSLPRQDSNLESSAPEADALSIRPRETLEDVYEDYAIKAVFGNT
jgi:hypothetical protein